MKYYRFSGQIDYTNSKYLTKYEEYLAFDNDTVEAEIKHHSTDFAIEYANKYSKVRTTDKETFINAAIDNAVYAEVTEEEFLAAIDI